MKAICEGCGSEIDFRVDQEPQFLNSPTTSALIVNHPHTAFCLTCKTRTALFLAGAGLRLAARPISEKQKSPIVLAPAGALLKEPR